MSRVVSWLQQHENRMFYYINQRIQHNGLDLLFSKITHLGGATSTILISLCLSIFGQGVLRTAGIQSLIALTLSHIPVAIVKKKYPRLRPYLVMPEANICKNPLTDHSFPSGHTTAIFSIVLPLSIMVPSLALPLLAIALLVSVSRMYLGLHYPSDCAAGCLIGSMTALFTNFGWNMMI